MNYYTYNMEIGKILIGEEEGEIVCVQLNRNDIKREEDKKMETQIIIQTKTQLEEYLKGTRKEFNIPLKLKGTDFQKKVWKELLKIPYGETRSYLDIAKKVGNSKASRAVGMANNKNKIMIIVPCHRVIGSNKKLIGYAGGLELKEKLLRLEQKWGS